MWDIIVLSTYLILSCVYLWAQIQAERGKMSAVALRVISVIALVCAVLVHSVTAWIFGLQIAKEGWYSAIMAPIFVASAMDSGLALLVLALLGLRARGVFETTDELLTSLAGLLCTCIAVDAYFIGCEILTTAYNGTEGGMAVCIGRLRPDTQYDYKFVCLSHNTLRGAAGGAVELAELLAAEGYITRK